VAGSLAAARQNQAAEVGRSPAAAAGSPAGAAHRQAAEVGSPVVERQSPAVVERQSPAVVVESLAVDRSPVAGSLAAARQSQAAGAAAEIRPAAVHKDRLGPAA
jgi:hypothetical protein